jgi:hypothetical protein
MAYTCVKCRCSRKRAAHIARARGRAQGERRFYLGKFKYVNGWNSSRDPGIARHLLQRAPKPPGIANLLFLELFLTILAAGRPGIAEIASLTIPGAIPVTSVGLGLDNESYTADFSHQWCEFDDLVAHDLVVAINHLLNFNRAQKTQARRTYLVGMDGPLRMQVMWKRLLNDQRWT